MRPRGALNNCKTHHTQQEMSWMHGVHGVALATSTASHLLPAGVLITATRSNSSLCSMCKTVNPRVALELLTTAGLSLRL